MGQASNFAIGVDIESISRFKNLKRDKSRHFLEKIFTQNELNYCFSKKVPSPHLAVRFAAKEAAEKERVCKAIREAFDSWSVLGQRSRS